MDDASFVHVGISVGVGVYFADTFIVELVAYQFGVDRVEFLPVVDFGFFDSN